MQHPKPDLSQIDPEIREYIEHLEAEITRLQGKPKLAEVTEDEEFELPIQEPSELPTTLNIISATASGHAKRTPRHLYTRQRRGGMGVFDQENPDDDPPTILCCADENQTLLIITNLGRVFRVPVSAIVETPVHGRGVSIVQKFGFAPGEKLVAALPIQAQGYLAAVSNQGMVRVLRHHVFGEYMKPGTSLYDIKSFGQVASACWAPGDGDLLIATRSGKAIRFSEKLVPPQGGLGMRLADDDSAVAITAVYEDSGVFLLGADGKGTIRDMKSFTANKAAGSGGKIAMSTFALAAAVTVAANDDIFITSRLGKIIRFQTAEVPVKDGVVQGVICMSFRSDEAVALTIGSPVTAL